MMNEWLLRSQAGRPKSARKATFTLLQLLLTLQQVVAEFRRAGLVRDLRPFLGPHRAGERNEKPQVSDEPCSTELKRLSEATR